MNDIGISTRKPDPVTRARALGPAIYHVHAKDTYVEPAVAGINGRLETKPGTAPRERAWNYVTLGYGHGEEWWRRFCATLKMAGYNGGYGLYVRLDHTAQVGTGYGHLSRLGPGIKPGIPVRQGQVIGFVGSTGMSTGPHLHYEFHRGGKQVNPLAQKFAMRAAVGGKDGTRFQALAKQYLAQMKNAPVVADTKPAKPKEPAAPQVAKGD